MSKAHNQKNSIAFAAAVSVPPSVPAAGGGVDIRGLRAGGTSERYQRIALTASAGQTLGGPVEFGGEVDGVVYKLGELNAGQDIVMTATKGYAEIVQFVGTYDRFYLVPTSISAGNYSGTIEGVAVE